MKKLVKTALTIGKVMLKSRSCGKRAKEKRHSTLIVMGNGPSLRNTLEDFRESLAANDLMAVNFAANTPEFFELRPSHYVIADPHFFETPELGVSRERKDNGQSSSTVESLWHNLNRIDWPMTLHLPTSARNILKDNNILLPKNISIRYFNMTPGEGYDFVCHTFYRKGLATPRPRNVLIPALMEGIREGYERIFIVGADHTWPHSLYVDEQNRVVTVQPHFYKDNKAELDRIAEVYSKVRLHEVLNSMVIAFRSYHEIMRFAKKEGVEIFNATPGSLIDAFPRKPLP